MQDPAWGHRVKKGNLGEGEFGVKGGIWGLKGPSEIRREQICTGFGRRKRFGNARRNVRIDLLFENLVERDASNDPRADR